MWVFTGECEYLRLNVSVNGWMFVWMDVFELLWSSLVSLGLDWSWQVLTSLAKWQARLSLKTFLSLKLGKTKKWVLAPLLSMDECAWVHKCTSVVSKSMKVSFFLNFLLIHFYLPISFLQFIQREAETDYPGMKIILLFFLSDSFLVQFNRDKNDSWTEPGKIDVTQIHLILPIPSQTLIHP